MGQRGARADRTRCRGHRVTADTLPPALAEIVEDFSSAPPRDRLEMLLEYAGTLPPLPERYREHPERLEPVPECQSPLFVATEVEPDGTARGGGPRRSTRSHRATRAVRGRQPIAVAGRRSPPGTHPAQGQGAAGRIGRPGRRRLTISGASIAGTYVVALPRDDHHRQARVTITAPSSEPMMPLARRSNPSPATRLKISPPTNEPTSPDTSAIPQSTLPPRRPRMSCAPAPMSIPNRIRPMKSMGRSIGADQRSSIERFASPYQ